MILRNSAKLLVLLLSVSHQVKAVAEYGQCGGIGYTGSTVCDSGLACVYLNAWYSQCLKAVSSVTNTVSIANPSTTTSTLSRTSALPSAIPSTTPCLDQKFKANGKKYFGTVVNTADLSDPATLNIIIRCFGSITPANVFKWDAIEPAQNSFNFVTADAMVNWGVTYNKLIRGHTLVWHSQLPSWVSQISSPTVLTSAIQNHITVIAGRYRGKIYAWDVVNEVFNEDGSFRSSVFYNVLGENFVSISFAAAKAADPIAKLYINDYNLDSVNAKVNSLVTHVKKWKAAGVPIEGIGSEAHLSAGGAGGIASALSTLAAAGVDVAITELDVLGSSPTSYISAINACVNLRACVGISVSGVTDERGWISTNPGRLWDENAQPKPAFTAILNAM